MKEYTIKIRDQFSRGFEILATTDDAAEAKKLYLHYTNTLYGYVKLVKTATDENLVGRTRYNKVWFKI